MSKEVFLIVGLGNPGLEYAHTRHNAGFEVMSLLEKHYGVSIDRKMLHGLVREVTEGDRKLVLCRRASTCSTTTPISSVMGDGLFASPRLKVKSEGTGASICRSRGARKSRPEAFGEPPVVTTT